MCECVDLLRGICYIFLSSKNEVLMLRLSGCAVAKGVRMVWEDNMFNECECWLSTCGWMRVCVRGGGLTSILL